MSTVEPMAIEGLLIGGARVSAANGGSFDVYNPSTGDVFARRARCCLRGAMRDAVERKVSYIAQAFFREAALLLPGRKQLRGTLDGIGVTLVGLVIGIVGVVVLIGVLGDRTRGSVCSRFVADDRVEAKVAQL